MCEHLKSHVLMTRRDGNTVYRRRRCGFCFENFWTSEQVVAQVPAAVQNPSRQAGRLAKAEGKRADVEKSTWAGTAELANVWR